MAELPDISTPAAVIRGSMTVLLDQIHAADQAVAAASALRMTLVHQLGRCSAALQEAQNAERVAQGKRALFGSEIAARSLRAELATTLRVPERTAENMLGTATLLLTDRRATFDALATGAITERHAKTLIDHLADVDLTRRAAVEAEALPLAETLTVAQFDRKLRALCESSDPECLDTRHHRAVEGRGVWVTPAKDGMAWLEALLPAPVAYATHDRLTKIAKRVGADEKAARNQEHATPTTAEQPVPRTRDQIRADTLEDLLVDGTTHTMPDTTRGIRAEVTVTVPVLTLLDEPADDPQDGHADPRRSPATMNGRIPIDSTTARELTAHAPTFTRILTDPENGTILSVGRTRYSPPEDLKRAIRLRDTTCRFPGCRHPANLCEIDHTADWHTGGHTALTNLMTLCTGHHTLKHASDWRVSQTPDGTATWTSPGGKTYTTRPEHPLPTGNELERILSAPGRTPSRLGTRATEEHPSGDRRTREHPRGARDTREPAMSAARSHDPGAPPF